MHQRPTTGQKHHPLPVPSGFLVEAGGTIRGVYSNPDYEIRPENAAILKAARGLAKTTGDKRFCQLSGPVCDTPIGSGHTQGRDVMSRFRPAPREGSKC